MKGIKEVEVSAIMEAHGPLLPLAISPDGEHIYAYRADYKRWYEVWPPRMTPVRMWNIRKRDGRKIWRGIFKIKVNDYV